MPWYHVAGHGLGQEIRGKSVLHLGRDTARLPDLQHADTGEYKAVRSPTHTPYLLMLPGPTHRGSTKRILTAHCLRNTSAASALKLIWVWPGRVT